MFFTLTSCSEKKTFLLSLQKCKKGLETEFLFTTVPLKALSDQE